MGTHRKSIVKETIDRFDSKMAIGQSRRDAKKALRQEQGPTWSVSTGKIHSYKTRSGYQEHAIRFVKWVRDRYHITSLAQLDPRAAELAREYLQLRIQEQKSPSTLQKERSALRLFFGDWTLARDVDLPIRAREKITRSRGPAAHDRYFQPENWPELLNFLRATGVRRQELRDLKCSEVYHRHDGQLVVYVRSGKGGREREVPVLSGRDEHILSVVEGRSPDEHIFSRIPKHLDVHSYRREFAQALYLFHAPGWTLPPAFGRLKRTDYNRDAAQKVTEALGHNRIDVVLRHYIR